MSLKHKPNQSLHIFITILINPQKDEYNALDFFNPYTTYKCKRLQMRDARPLCNRLHFCRKMWY